MAAPWKPKAADIVILCLSLAAVAGSAYLSAKSYAGNPRLIVEAQGRRYVYPLNQDSHIQAPGPLGLTQIHIEDGHAHIETSPCENQLCVAMGKIDKKGQWLACLPNRVFVRIEGGSPEEEVDAASY